MGTPRLVAERIHHRYTKRLGGFVFDHVALLAFLRLAPQDATTGSIARIEYTPKDDAFSLFLTPEGDGKVVSHELLKIGLGLPDDVWITGFDRDPEREDFGLVCYVRGISFSAVPHLYATVEGSPIAMVDAP